MARLIGCTLIGYLCGYPLIGLAVGLVLLAVFAWARSGP